METKIVDGLLIVKLNLIQTVAVAFIVYFMGLRIRQQVPIFARFSIPAPVIGGLFFATVATLLRSEGIVGFEFDETMQYTLMIMFFTTIGMGASILLVKRGGLPLLIYFGLAGILAIFQNVVGIVMAKIIGIHPLLGIVAGAISLMGGLGTGGAFGPLFESWGVAGATSAAFACATFGMVIGSLIGGPFGETLISRYRLRTPVRDQDSAVMYESEAAERDEAVNVHSLIVTLGYIVVAMGFGSVISDFFNRAGITLPPYIGSMIVAAIMRNIGDITGKYRINTNAVGIVGDISLAIYLTLAINGLKLWELVNLAMPLLIILLAQTLFILVFCWLVVYFVMGRDYEAVLFSVGMIGFGMGATPNALVNMAVLKEKYGPAPKAYLIVPLIGAFLIDFLNALIITAMAGFYR